MDLVARSRRVLLRGRAPQRLARVARVAPRPRRALLAVSLVVSVAVAACAAKKPEARVGESDARAVANRVVVDAGADAGLALSPSLASYRATMTKITPARVPSVGHASGRFEIDVYCNQDGCDALQRGTAPKEGAAFAVEHTERAAGAAKGPVYFMEKKRAGYAPARGDFRYVVVGASGVLVADGPTDACADCHDEAPNDRVFPVGVVRADGNLK